MGFIIYTDIALPHNLKIVTVSQAKTSINTGTLKALVVLTVITYKVS